jgi:hypothetical protein
MSLDFAKRGNWTEQEPQLYLQGLFDEASTQKHPLGTRRRISDGREFIYVKMGATNAVAGSIYQGVAPVVANHANLAITANANIGDKAVSITMGDSTLANTANALAEGYLWINTGAGNGHAYKIKSHAAIAANANGNIALYDKLRANIAAASSKASVLKHPCKDVIVHPSPPTQTPVGAATFIVTANYYAWLQCKGPAAVEVDGTVVNGDGVRCSANVDGAVEPSANGTETEYHVGVVMCNSANDHWCLVNLNL